MKFARFTGLLALGGAVAVGCGSETGADLGHDQGSGGSATDSGAGSGVGGSTSGGSGNGASGSGAASAGGNGSGSKSGVGGSGTGSMGNLGGMAGGEPMLPTDIKFTYDPTKDVEIETCAATQVESQEVLLDMFVILDRSGSMTEKPAPDAFSSNDARGYCDIGDVNVGSRWCNAINALYGFFEDPSTMGTGVSYAEFGSTGCGAFAMDVPFAILEAGDANGQLQSLRDALNDKDPADYTQTEGAVRTLIAQTSAHVPVGTRKTISVLITDGEPRDPSNGAKCIDTTAAEELVQLNGLMSDHFTSTGIPTFIIGMDGTVANNLDTLATGAGAELHTDYCITNDPDCSYYSVGDGNPQVFIDALESIRQAVLGCEYSVPSADVGVENLSTLDVQFTPASGATAVSLKRVDAEGACGADDEYWVDLPVGQDPIIKLCPATCDTRGEGASVDISLKCEGQ